MSERVIVSAGCSVCLSVQAAVHVHTHSERHIAKHQRACATHCSVVRRTASKCVCARCELRASAWLQSAENVVHGRTARRLNSCAEARLKLHASMCIAPCIVHACTHVHSSMRSRAHARTPPSVECAKLAEYGTSRRRVLMSDVVTRVRTDAHAWSATPIGTTECPCIALQRLHASECRVSRTYLTRLCWCKNVSTHLSKDLHRQHSNGQC
jgi:hypothetical protein